MDFQEQIMRNGRKIAFCTLNAFRPHLYYDYEGQTYYLSGTGCINQGSAEKFIESIIAHKLRFVKLIS